MELLKKTLCTSNCPISALLSAFYCQSPHSLPTPERKCRDAYRHTCQTPLTGIKTKPMTRAVPFLQLTQARSFKLHSAPRVFFFFFKHSLQGTKSVTCNYGHSQTKAGREDFRRLGTSRSLWACDRAAAQRVSQRTCTAPAPHKCPRRRTSRSARRRAAGGRTEPMSSTSPRPR